MTYAGAQKYYDGEWKQGKRHGKGNYYDRGSRWDCLWIEDSK